MANIASSEGTDLWLVYNEGLDLDPAAGTPAPVNRRFAQYSSR